MSHSYVNCMIQDSRGFLWFGTEDGLNRYDGHRCEVFRTLPGDVDSLSHIRVKSLWEDGAGIIWIGTVGGGLNRYRPADNRFESVRPPPNAAFAGGSGIVHHIEPDRWGRLWLGTECGLVRFDPGTERWAHFPPDRRSTFEGAELAVEVMASRGKDELWLGTRGGGLLVFDTRLGRYRGTTPAALAGATVWALAQTAEGLLIGSDRGLWRRSDEGRLEAVTGVAGSVRALGVTRAGDLLVGTERGLARRVRGQGDFEFVRAARGQPGSLSSDRVRCLMEDHSGVVWVGTDDGLNHFAPDRRKFAGAGHAEFDERLTYRNVHLIFEDRLGNLWVGGQGMGLVRNEFDRRRSTSFFPGAEIRCMTEDGSGRLWVGSNRDGLFRLEANPRSDVRPRRYVFDPKRSESLCGKRVFALLRDRRGHLWVGTERGLDRYRPESDDFEHLIPALEGRGPLIYCLNEDRAGDIWVGTLGHGLMRLDPASKPGTPVTRRFTRRDGPGELGSDDILCVTEARSGALWIGTNGGGLNRFDRARGRFTRFTERDGLASNTIYGILQDERQRLWLSTNNGVTRFDPATETFRNYGSGDGLQSLEFNGGAYLKSRTGMLFFGGKYGVNSFEPDWIQANPHPPKTVITRVSTDRNGHFAPVAADGAALRLTHRDRLLSLEFAALHYVAPERNRFAFKMEGLEETWHEAGDRRSVTYSNLEPGHYLFRVRSANGDRVWDERGESIHIRVIPAVWQTWWLRVAGLIGMGSIAIWMYRRHMHFLLERRQALERLDLLTAQTRQGALVAHEAHNPIFAVNNSLRVINRKVQGMDPELDDLLQLLGSEMDRLRRIVKRQSDFTKRPLPAFENADLRDLVTAAIKVLKWGNRLGRTKISIVASGGFFPIHCNPESLQQVFMNVIGNAVESMSGGGRLEIDLEQTSAAGERHYIVHFKDNGPGFDKAASDHLFQPFASTRTERGTGLGLFISHNLIKKHRGEITLNAQYHGGAHLMIRIPRDGGCHHEESDAPVDRG
ncbi:ligand-binding sensor domain-containing protein [Sulfidibacter corallicola]|uniref:histidine kinase n=1 Tax=Sulfidibacter corallicola TaxID=2818388 RepID=A0A8A4TDK1_SULCO|nr:sensor histidine kinase [Sulfidibacter corallicola]QTD47647.1 hypothetical protein J3U87_18805 [Sulfidibacter corallicola]